MPESEACPESSNDERVAQLVGGIKLIMSGWLAVTA